MSRVYFRWKQLLIVGLTIHCSCSNFLLRFLFWILQITLTNAKVQQSHGDVSWLSFEKIEQIMYSCLMCHVSCRINHEKVTMVGTDPWLRLWKREIFNKYEFPWAANLHHNSIYQRMFGACVDAAPAQRMYQNRLMYMYFKG